MTDTFFNFLTESISSVGAFLNANFEEIALWNGTAYKENEKYIFVGTVEHSFRLLKKNIKVVSVDKNSAEIKYKKSNGDNYKIIFTF